MPSASPSSSSTNLSTPPATPPRGVDRRVTPPPAEQLSFKQRLKARLNHLHRHTALNPYWLDMKYLHEAVRDVAQDARGWMLDVGVGERPYTALFGHVERYIGVEYPAACENLVEGITSRVTADMGIVDVWCDGHKLPFEDGCFDTVLSTEVLEHVPDPEKFLREMFRVLRPGGHLLITVPFGSAQHAMPYDYYRYTEPGVRALVERRGFVVERIAARGNFAAVVGVMTSQWLLRAFGARRLKPDGAVSLSKWRAPVVLPLAALTQLFFAAMAKLLPDDQLTTMGWGLVARRPEDG